MRAILLLNENDSLAQWQYDALSVAMSRGLQIILVAHCTNTPKRIVTRKTAAYYGFAWFSHRSIPTSREASISGLVPLDIPRINFRADQEGAWQRIPPHVSTAFSGADVVVKFGMTLLRGADALPVRFGVLSYHHGDPTQYRGRPAGFYELMNDEAVQGVIVQRLSDTLDGGEILAHAYSRVVPYSYAQTLRAAQGAGVPLLAKALKNLNAGERLPQPGQLGKNYRLPDTSTVAQQTARLARRKLRRAAYGISGEKSWRIARVNTSVRPESHVRIAHGDLEDLPMPNGYTFAADPWWHDGFIYAELLNASTGLGEIGRYHDQHGWELPTFRLAGHASYPQVIEDAGRTYLFPEIAEFSSPQLFRIRSDGHIESHGQTLSGLEAIRIIDGTLFQSGGYWFLFGGVPATAESDLRLWSASSATGPYEEHPCSPICTDARGARMAGPMTKIDGRLYRFGQNGTRNYGASVRIHRVRTLTRSDYSEEECGSIGIADGWGPHTLNVLADGLLIDHYSERFSPLAGWRRVRARTITKFGPFRAKRPSAR